MSIDIRCTCTVLEVPNNLPGYILCIIHILRSTSGLPDDNPISGMTGTFINRLNFDKVECRDKQLQMKNTFQNILREVYNKS